MDVVTARHLVEEAVADHRAGQDPTEFAPLLVLLAENPPRRVLEIGTFCGGTLWLLSRIATDDATLVSVDDFSWSYGSYEPLAADDLARGAQQVCLISGSSEDESTQSKVKACFDEPIDLLLIDGDHTYEGAKSDWEAYSPLVRAGGLVAFHDILEWAPEREYGVHLLWAEIKDSYSYETYEFLAEISTPAGLGVVVISAARDS